MQPYHTLNGSRSLLPSLFEVCGNPDATLSHFEGVKTLLPSLFKVWENSDATLSHFEGVKVASA